MPTPELNINIAERVTFAEWRKEYAKPPTPEELVDAEKVARDIVKTANFKAVHPEMPAPKRYRRRGGW